MRFNTILVIALFAFVALACESDEYQIYVEKKTKSWASEESYRILHVNALLATSEEFTNNAVRTYYHCLPKYADGVYKLQMLDSAKDGWTDGAYIRILGPDGQLVYLGQMTQRGVESVTVEFSLMYLIQSTDSWKITTKDTPASDWTSYSFNDATWTSQTGGRVITNSGTVYIRKTFTGLSNMAAYELTYFLQYGIIIYVGGKEVFRDNMASGSVTANTASTGSYTSLSQHSIIRNGLEIESSSNVVAMEFHYEDNTSSHSFRLQTFLAPYMADVGDSCYQSYESFTIDSSSQKTETESYLPDNVFDLDPSSYWTETTTSNRVDMTWSNWIPQINGFSINVGSYRTYAPSTFTIRGYQKDTSTSSTLLLQKTDHEYDSTGENLFNLVVNDDIYQKIRFTSTKTAGTLFRMYELRYLTCRYSVPEKMEYPQTSLNLLAYVDTVKMLPTYDGFNQCTVSPTLPSGLSITSTTCAISGTPRETVDGKSYTITSRNPFQTTAVITITVTACEKTVVELSRTYDSVGYVYETHAFRNLNSGDVVERVTANTEQKASTTVSHRYCIDAGLYELTVDHSSSTAWDAGSYIDVNVIHETESVTLAHWKYDQASGYAASITINIDGPVKRSEEWSYFMNDVPENWDSNTVPESWSKAKKGSFPDAENQLQIFKKKFTMEDDAPGSGFELEIRYQYGIIVVINEVEMFRRFVEGAPTNETYASNGYSSLSYHRITLPVTKGGQQIIRKGDNTITIFLIARLATQTTGSFDASLRVMGRETVGRVMDFTVAASDSTVTPNYLFDLSGSTVYSSTSCGDDRYIQIQFNNDRREWISKYTLVSSPTDDQAGPNSWIFQAKNSEDSDWTTLDTITSTNWWYTSQVKEVWVNNEQPWNMYRWTSVKAASETTCDIYISQIGLFSDLLTREQPELDYVGSTTGYLNVDFTDIKPNCAYYKQYTVEPDLPSFLSIDYVSGVIRGSQLSLYTATNHTVTAKNLAGETVTKILTISVIQCDRVMIELTVRSDSYPEEMSWYLRAGEEQTGDAIASKVGFNNRNAYEYKYFCVDPGLYTFDFVDSWGDGWAVPAGWRISYYQGYTIAAGSMPRTGESNSHKYQTFAAQVLLTQTAADWKIVRESPKNSWKNINFDDSAWTTVTAGSVGAYQAITNYLRHSINVPDINTYPVLNLVIRFSAGAIVYLNGQAVYRVNLPADAKDTTYATETHSYGLMEFSVPLQARGGVTGVNMIAVELHRAESQKADAESYFTMFASLATGECALLRNDVHSYKTSDNVVSGSAYYMFDTTTMNYISWDWAEGTYVDFEYENLEGLPFNQYRIYGDGNPGDVSWTLYGKNTDDEVYTTIEKVKSATIPDRSRYESKVPNGMLGFNQYHLVFDDVTNPTAFSIDEFEFAYCPYTATRVCPGVGNYPSTGEGEISVSTCPEYYDGYSFRRCTNGKLGEVDLTNCVKYAPSNLHFEQPRYTVYVGAEITGVVPLVHGLVDDYQILPELPEGVTFNDKTGALGGVPVNVTTSILTFTVTGYNEMGSASGTFELSIIRGYCPVEDKWPRTEVGVTVEYDCKQLGATYVGTMKRTCKLGKNEPEWSLVVGVCMSQATMIATIIVIVLIIIVVIIVVLKVSSDKKKENARRGVKGGKKALNIMKSVPYAKI